jgi:hypothetical protein
MIEVNGVEYKCDDETDRTVETVGISNSREKMTDVIFRKFLEMNGQRYVLTRIGSIDQHKISVISIPNGVEKVGKQCESLCEVFFESDSKLKEIGDCAFSRSGFESIRIPSNVEKIGNGCFSFCFHLSEVTFEG